MTIEEKYILLKEWSFADDLLEEIKNNLEKHSLSNLLVLPKGNNEDIELAKSLNEMLLTNNGLACFYGNASMKEINDLKLDYTISLPTQHEAVEAVMMNILENEFLSFDN